MRKKKIVQYEDFMKYNLPSNEHQSQSTQVIISCLFHKIERTPLY